MILKTLVPLCNLKKVSLVTIDPRLDKILIAEIKNKKGKIYYEKILKLPENQKLRELIKINPETSMKLNNLKIIESSNKLSKELIENEKLTKKLLDGYVTGDKDKILQKIEREIKSKKRNEIDIFEEKEKNLETKPEYIAELEKIIRELELEKTKENKKKEKKNTKREILKIIEYLRGRWLEELVFEMIKKIAEKEKVKIKKNVVIEHKGRKAEIDILISTGYNQAIISVTTSRTMGLVKLKLFEALHRANQIGGMHSKVILVTLMEKWQIEQIKKDISQFELKERTEIIGVEEIEKITEKLKGIFI
ncbi:MAG: hypothetical protein ACTSSL_04460 [Candidatus Heimdallarchaeaceae archaeon]